MTAASNLAKYVKTFSKISEDLHILWRRRVARIMVEEPLGRVTFHELGMIQHNCHVDR